MRTALGVDARVCVMVELRAQRPTRAALSVIKHIDEIYSEGRKMLADAWVMSVLPIRDSIRRDEGGDAIPS